MLQCSFTVEEGLEEYFRFIDKFVEQSRVNLTRYVTFDSQIVTHLCILLKPVEVPIQYSDH